MSLPIVAIVGRPNVGKSRLFNRLIGKFHALVDDQPGVTRDRHYGLSDWRGRSFLVVDTGGFIPGAEEPLNQKVWGQAFLAIQEADLIVCLLDGQEGLHPVDAALVKELRRTGKPLFFAANKIDTASHEKSAYDFARLGVDPLLMVSAEHGRGVSDLLEALYEAMPVPDKESSQEAPNTLRLSIIGRPNVGKSTLVNKLLGEERVVVHEEAGTTRDAIDVVIERDNRQFILVDTAGLKRKSATKTRLEKFSAIKSLRAMEQSQIVCLLLDAMQGVTHQDLQLAHYVWAAKRGLLFLVNKWDQMQASPKKYMADLRPQLRELQKVPVLCISAKTGENCSQIWKEVQKIDAAMQTRLTTAKLNQWLERALLSHSLPLYKGKTVKIYYGTQVGIYPPHFILFTNVPMGIPDAYRRYLSHGLEEALGVEGIPLRLTFRLRKS